MLKPVELYFENLTEPAKSCMLALRAFLLRFDEHIEETWKYKLPFYCYKGKMFCYLWTKKNGQPYIGIVKGMALEYPQLLQEDRKRMKILLIDPNEDLPEEILRQILVSAKALY